MPPTRPAFRRIRLPSAVALGLACVAAAGTLAAPETATATAPAPTCGASGVAVQVLGSGGPEMKGRASSSYLVWQQGKARLLIDAGGGSALRFGESSARMSDLEAVLFSHLHSDHSADFPVLVKSAHFEPRKEALPVLGPPGTELMPSMTAFVDALFAPKTGLYRYLGKQGNESSFELTPQTLTLDDKEVRQVFESPHLKVFATVVLHAKIPSLAYRVEIDGKRITFSGDTNGNNGNLEKLAAQSQMFVAHHAIDDGFHSPSGERTLHMPPALIGKIAASAGVGEVILSHRRPETLGKEASAQKAIEREYKGPVRFANDLDCFAVP